MIRKSRHFVKPISTKCSFCEQGTVPDYKEHQVLKGFVTERGKLLGRPRTGVCQKHQRKLTTAVKRARHLARLAFVTTLK